MTTAGEERAWSVILKLLKSPAGLVMPKGMVIFQAMADDRSSFGYWRREAEAYQGGLPAWLPPGLAAPTCYSVHTCGMPRSPGHHFIPEFPVQADFS
ncbi:MAG: hypothetical protein IPK16_29955 [Anaerolineales bacterium]|nr:hypothetical protein [Anaerolineales bacterium]